MASTVTNAGRAIRSTCAGADRRSRLTASRFVRFDTGSDSEPGLAIHTAA